MESFIKFPQQFFNNIPKHNSTLDQFDDGLQLLKYLLRLSIYFNEVEILISTNDWLRARKILDKSEEQLKKSKHFLVYLPRIKKLSAWVHNVKSEFSESESELNLGLIIAKELQNKKTYSELLLHLGNCYFYQTKYDKALDCYNQVKEITLKTMKNNPDDLEYLKLHASILNNIGMIY
ncbi:tetratricopeptide repeat protein [Candidatus Dependentiae bacterium]|nr:tetratricopeptide repeat protein [Candidatus Dependentiae bacterium]